MADIAESESVQVETKEVEEEAVASEEKEPEQQEEVAAEEQQQPEDAPIVEEEQKTEEEEKDGDEPTTEEAEPSEEVATEAKQEAAAEGDQAGEATTEEKVSAEATPDGKALGDTVAKHYNENPHVSKEGRKESQIFHLRNFNNWVKSVMINEYLDKLKRNKKHKEELNVLDLGCGKGGDYLKWQKGNVNHVICADIAETSLEQCKERYQSLKRDDSRRHRDHSMTTEFIHADCTKQRLRDSFEHSDIQLDLSSCQFAYHYSFESLEQADMMLKNACENLRDGGYFIGTTPDSYKLVQRVRDAEETSFGNEIYSIDFEDKENFPLFGAKYNFKLHDVVDCPEFLVYFPALEKLAEKYNMKLVYKKDFHEMFQEKHEDYCGLLYRMQAMECIPPREGKALSCDKEGAYEVAKKLHENPPSTTDPKYRTMGTLSKNEWEAAGLYLAFAFQKCDPKPEPEETKEAESKEKVEENPEEKSEDATPATADAAATEQDQAAEDATMSEEGQTTKEESVPEVPVVEASEETTEVTEENVEEAEEASEAVEADAEEPAAKRSKSEADE